MKKTVKIISGVLLGLALLFGLALALIEPIKSWIRQSYSNAAVEAAEEAVIHGSGVITFNVPKSDALAVEGEDGEINVGLDKLLKDMSDLSDEHESLTLLGILEIPCIDVKEPIWDTCSTNALRYGVGRYPGTVNIGEDGLCNIFGHRQIGDIDTKLGSIQYLVEHIGEEVIVTTTDGTTHIYKIVDTVYVKDAELMPYLDPTTYDRETLCITACGWGEDPCSGETYPMNTEFIVICQPASED